MAVNFINLLKSKFDDALKAQALLFINSEQRSLTSASGQKFQVRYAPSLATKPTRPQDQKCRDPFAPPYVRELFVCDWAIDESLSKDEDESYAVLLNKYCVVPRHFLLVTKAFQSQMLPPSPMDLFALDAILKQAHATEPENDWIAFYNCGPESGASQPHKHFQFLPVEKSQNPFGDLITSCSPEREDDAFSFPSLSFTHFAVLLPKSRLSSKSASSDSMEMELGRRFMTLLDLMILHLRHMSNKDTSVLRELSYNFVMTHSYMLLVPRSQENFGSSKISINSLGVGAGMILVKDQNQLDELMQMGIDQILAGVTFPILEKCIDPCSNE
ncbi:hypothetical protein O181_079630 [Austropuccinia psidii MF-1]|uniref:HIT domain-containing protein n=1 Tax=Austropuccinia psidii MF-1 TaxID=1389203 RepID=A0A9Q3FLR6_9BASI|nr:hypothetical protein [Austropuccinia psidii MF-1]